MFNEECDEEMSKISLISSGKHKLTKFHNRNQKVNNKDSKND